MSSITKCFDREFPELNVDGKYPELHNLQPTVNPSDGVLVLSPDTPEERIRALFLSRAHSDLKITLQQSGEIFKVHKLILSMTSPIFARMFASDSDSIILDDNPDAVKWILMHAYLGHCELPFKVSDIITLHEFLHKYAMNEMAMKCILILRKSINTETLDEIYTVSLKYKDNLLKRKCIEEIQRSGRKLLEMASKGSLSPDLFLSVLGSESLEVPEIDIFKAVMSWAKIKIKNFENLDFKKFLKPYLYEIDFLSMQQEEILGPVTEEEIFTKEEIFAILLGSKNVTDELATDGESSCKNLHSYFGVPASYPMYLRIQRRERRFFHSQLHGISIQIFMYLKCDHKGKWLPCGHFPILTLQVSAEIYITRIRARPECFVGENFLEVMDHDIVLGSSNVNGPPWDFNPPVEIVRNRSYVINLNGKGKICHHEFQMYSKTHGNIEICGNSILCDVTVRYIK